MILKGETIYLKKDLQEENYALILKGFTDLDVMKYVGFVKRSLKLNSVDEAKKFDGDFS